MSMLFTLVVQGEEPPEVQGFWAINYCQIGDTGRSRIGVGSRVRSPRKFRGFGQ